MHLAISSFGSQKSTAAQLIAFFVMNATSTADLRNVAFAKIAYVKPLDSPCLVAITETISVGTTDKTTVTCPVV
jgi:hypothetical protein